MDFIKKHFEKLLLAGGLVVLIGCAAYLGYQVAKLTEELQDAPRLSRGKQKTTVMATPTTTYSNALTSLQVPSIWRPNAVDPFDTTLKWVPPPPPPDSSSTGDVVSIIKIIPQPFKLKFQSYKDPGKDFAINFITRNRTFFVEKVGMEIADAFEKTGYFITKFEKKQAAVYNRSLNITNLVDLSELTIEKQDTPAIVLVLDKVAQEKEPVGLVLCHKDNQEVRVRKGDEFTCGGKTYKVIDITPMQMIIEDTQSKEKHTIGLPGVKE